MSVSAGPIHYPRRSKPFLLDKGFKGIFNGMFPTNL